jgi:hypothetical protein
MRSNIPVAWLLVTAVCLSSCGGGDGESLTPVASTERPPNFISYPDPNMFTQFEPITPLVPTITGGTPTNYLVEPPLPAGLNIDGQGRISGTPTERSAPTTYIVTAGNSAGTTSFGVRITISGRYTIGGSVFGLTGAGLVLTNADVDLAVDSDGRFTFPDLFRSGDAFAITVESQPDGQSCSVTGGSGLVANSNYGDAVVTCSAPVNKAARFVGVLEDLARTRAGDSGEVQYVACFYPPAPGTRNVILLLGNVVYELEPLPGTEPPVGCGLHAVTLDPGSEWLYVLNVTDDTVSVYSVLSPARPPVRT